MQIKNKIVNITENTKKTQSFCYILLRNYLLCEKLRATL